MNQDWNFNTSQMFSYYPKYEYLDNVISTTNRQKLNLYIDFKGCAQALFQEWAVKQILYQSQGSNSIDTSLFSAVMEFIAFHKSYANKRGIELKMHFFMENGKSEYHMDVYPDYKMNRGVGDFFGLDMEQKDYFFTILHKNYAVCDRIANKLPNVTFINLDRIEADFVPYYIMKHCLSEEELEDTAHIIYSMDKDLLQCLDRPNIFQFYRHYKNVKMLSNRDIYNHWLKCEFEIDDAAKWMPLSLAIVGDVSDDYKGVSGVGAKTYIKLFDNIQTLCGNSMDKVYHNIKSENSIFSSSYKPNNATLQKIIDNEDIIIRNLKLASFELLSDHINGDYPSSVFKKKKYIHETINNTNKCHDAGVLHNALIRSGQPGLISEQTLVNLF